MPMPHLLKTTHILVSKF